MWPSNRNTMYEHGSSSSEEKKIIITTIVIITRYSEI